MMQSKSAKQVTFNLLDKMTPGSVFTGQGLSAQVMHITGDIHFPATTLRYMREWRELAQREVECINKRKSMYQVMR